MDSIKPLGNLSAMEPLLDPKETATVLKVFYILACKSAHTGRRAGIRKDRPCSSLS